MQVFASIHRPAAIRVPLALTILAAAVLLSPTRRAEAYAVGAVSGLPDRAAVSPVPAHLLDTRMEQHSRRGGSGSGGGGGQAVPRGGSGGGSGSGGSSGGSSGGGTRSGGSSSGGSGSSGGSTTGSPRTRSSGGSDGSSGTAVSRPRDGRPVQGTAVERRDDGGGNRGGDRTVIVGGGYYGGYYPWGWGGLGLGGYYGYYDPWSWGYDPYTPSAGYWSGPEGSLKLKVSPRQAEVYVDGYYAGSVDDYDGAFQRLHLEPGPHRIEVRLQGYEPLAFEVRIPPGRTVTYKGTLERERAADPIADPR